MIIDYNTNQNYPLSPKDRKYMVITAYNGDTITIKARCYINEIPVNYDNSVLEFALLDQRFSLTELWRGTWRVGIEVNPDHPGLICVTIPANISENLRRGSYIFSLRVSDKLNEFKYTAFEGMLQIEYAPTSDTHDIPYKVT